MAYPAWMSRGGSPLIGRRRALAALGLGFPSALGCMPPAAAGPARSSATDTGVSHRGKRRGLDVFELAVGAAAIEVEVLASAYPQGAAEPLQWVRRAALAVADFYGKLPEPRVRLQMLATDGRAVGGGRVVVRDRPVIVLRVGTEATAEDLKRDWRLVHELVHLALPTLPRRHLWLSEGLATYVEPWVQVRTGWRKDQQVWEEWASNMPLGLPRAGDRGLDRTPTWARTYWGGALFCLSVDFTIRARSSGAHSLRSALRAVVERGGRISRQASIEQVFAMMQPPLAQAVCRQQYSLMKEAPHAVPLSDIWYELGVVQVADGLRLDGSAPRAELRREWFRSFRARGEKGAPEPAG